MVVLLLLLLRGRQLLVNATSVVWIAKSGLNLRVEVRDFLRFVRLWEIAKAYYSNLHITVQFVAQKGFIGNSCYVGLHALVSHTRKNIQLSKKFVYFIQVAVLHHSPKNNVSFKTHQK